MARAILYDSTLCVGCRACEEACSARWKLPYNEKIAAQEYTSAHKLTAVRTYGDRYSRKLCMACVDPACASVCPVAALKKTAAGPVVYDADRCMGCRYCMVACPYDVPAYQWDAVLPRVRKCDSCSDRVNEPTRCSEACPTGATITGDRAQLIVEAKKRLAEKPGEYFQQVYGIEAAGGTSVLVIAAVPFDKIGYASRIPNEALPPLTWSALQFVPDVVVGGGALMGGIFWITKRREAVALADSGGAASKGVSK